MASGIEYRLCQEIEDELIVNAQREALELEHYRKFCLNQDLDHSDGFSLNQLDSLGMSGASFVANLTENVVKAHPQSAKDLWNYIENACSSIDPKWYSRQNVAITDDLEIEFGNSSSLLIKVDDYDLKLYTTERGKNDLWPLPSPPHMWSSEYYHQYEDGESLVFDDLCGALALRWARDVLGGVPFTFIRYDDDYSSQFKVVGLNSDKKVLLDCYRAATGYLTGQFQGIRYRQKKDIKKKAIFSLSIFDDILKIHRPDTSSI